MLLVAWDTYRRHTHTHTSIHKRYRNGKKRVKSKAKQSTALLLVAYYCSCTQGAYTFNIASIESRRVNELRIFIAKQWAPCWCWHECTRKWNENAEKNEETTSNNLVPLSFHSIKNGCFNSVLLSLSHSALQKYFHVFAQSPRSVVVLGCLASGHNIQIIHANTRDPKLIFFWF